MRRRLTLALAAAFFGGSTILAHAQAPVVKQAGEGNQAHVGKKLGGIAGTGIGTAAGITANQVPLATGKGHVGAGTGGTGTGIGNATGGTKDAARAGTGGLLDTTAWGISTGGIIGTGRGLDAKAGGINESAWYGMDTGGINGSVIGSGVGGLNDLNSLGYGTGGINEQNAPRFRMQ